MTHTQPAPPPAAVPTEAPSLILAGNGTRVPAGLDETTRLADLVRALLPEVRVEVGYVELAEPALDEVLDTVLVESGAAVVVPLMAGPGGHVRQGVPRAVEGAKARHEDVTVIPTRHLGSPQPLIDAIHQRIAAARDTWPADETDVVLAGRGSNDTDANADHVRLSRVIFERGGYRQVLSAFIQIVGPDLRQILHQYYSSGSRRIVVMPHALFSGRLDESVRRLVDEFRASHPDAEIRIADVIGPCDELAAVVAQRTRRAPSGPAPRPAHART